MKIVIPGGTGHIGGILCRALRDRGHEVVVLSRHPVGAQGVLVWDGRTLGEWARAIDGCDAVINLAGRSVNCRYTKTNLQQMMDSRVESTQVIGCAIAQAVRPPRVWLQMSTATIYAHRFDAPNDEPRTDTELILKSRRVIPRRLLDAGFTFAFPEWPHTAQDLVRRWTP